MRWQTCDLWKAGIVVAGVLLLLVGMVWLPVSSVAAQKQGALATPVTGVTLTAQPTPTEDATVTALNKEKLTREVAGMQRTWENWLWSNAVPISSTLVIVLGALFGLWRWFADRRSEREKRVEELFQTAVTGLGDAKEGAKIGAAILLRSFLRRGYERYHTQVFDLAAAHLRPQKTNTVTLPNTGTPHPPEVPTALSHALMVLFVEAFPLARKQALKQEKKTRRQNPQSKVVESAQGVEVIIPLKEIQSLSARGICLDNGYLWYADLKQVWMPDASLRGTDLMGANLSEAILYGTHLDGAELWKTILSRATLWRATLSKADLRHADLRGAILLEADLSGANLTNADLSGANLREAILDGAKLVQANLSGTHPEHALSLKDTELHAVIGLTMEQKEACKENGAIITEAPPTSPSQSTVSPAPSSRSNDAQTPSAPYAQGSLPTSDTGGSSGASSQQEPKS